MTARLAAEGRVRVPAKALEAFVRRLLDRLGVPPADARVEAACLLAAHFQGADTHGVEELPDYAACLAEGRINPTPCIRIERRSPWALAVDGDNGMGHLVAWRSIDAAI